ncbi:hypothetical protein ACFL3S_02055, partial [Gemmatimonadota bacterium]
MNLPCLTRTIPPVGMVLFLSSILGALTPPMGLSAQVSGKGAEGDAGVGQIPVDPEAVPRPVAGATRTAQPLLLDGVLSEAAWEEAEAISGFIQSMPDAGYPATEETVVRVLYDDRNLYIGALLLDSEPEKIIAQFLDQDFET